MTARIFRSIFITATAVLFVSLFITFAFTYNSYVDLATSEARRECEYVKIGFEEYGEEYLKEIDVKGARITRVAQDGAVIFDTSLSSDLSSIPSHADREEIIDAFSVGEGVSKRYSEALGREMVYCAMLLSDGTVIRVGAECFSVAAMLGRIILPVLLVFFAVVGVAFVVAARLSRSIVKPINEINLSSPEEAGVYPELSPVIRKLSEQNYKISRQMSELKLRQSEFDSITGNMSEGMMIINSVGEILSANKSARDILIGGGELPKTILSLDCSEGFRVAISEALGGKCGFDTMRRDGKHYGITVTPVMRDGGIDGAVIFLIDDTEKESREELRREFTSNISHELKTPLTSISGFAELIRDGIADGEDAKRFAGNIYGEAQRLVTLVGDIIRLTQLDGAEVPYDGEVSLHEICLEVVDRISIVAERQGVTLSVDEKSDTGTVIGNMQILEEIVYNLADNGIKYNSNGGYVNLSVRTEADGVRLTVSDNGIGIPAAHRDRVFERFYRVDKSHSKDIGGTGLGLSIVKHAVMYHKAQLSLESELGRGTAVSVVFPLPKDSPGDTQI